MLGVRIMTRRNATTSELLYFTNKEPKKIFEELQRQRLCKEQYIPEFILIIKPESFTSEIYHVYTERYFTKHYPKLTLSRESMKLMGWL